MPKAAKLVVLTIWVHGVCVIYSFREIIFQFLRFCSGMVTFQSLVNELARTVSLKKEKSDGRKVVEALAKEAKKNEMLLKSSGTVKSVKANNFTCVFSKKGQKGFNQDCHIVWEVSIHIYYYKPI